MSVETIKIEVAQRVLLLEDEEILLKIQSLLNDGKDWYDDLTEEDRISLQKGIEQAERGELIPHKEVMKAFKKWH